MRRADAEAAAEAAQLPPMRPVSRKLPAIRAGAAFPHRELVVGQRTQTVDALRGHLAKHRLILGKGLGNVGDSRRTISPDWFALKKSLKPL